MSHHENKQQNNTYFPFYGNPNELTIPEGNSSSVDYVNEPFFEGGYSASQNFGRSYGRDNNDLLKKLIRVGQAGNNTQPRDLNASIDLGFNEGTMMAINTAANALGAGYSIWSGLKNLELAKEKFGFEKGLSLANLDNTITTTNNDITRLNELRASKGWSDMGNLLPTNHGLA